MHDLGHSQMEHNMNQFSGRYPAGVVGQQAEYNQPSPLQEILAAETGETPYQEAGYYEAPYEYAMGHEAPYQEAPYQGAAYQEAPQYGAVYQEAPYHEAPPSEYGDAGEYGNAAAYGEVGPYGSSLQETSQDGASLGEDEEIALAAELLEVNSEEEIDRFIGNFMRRVTRGARGFVQSPVGRMLGGVLRQTARLALPIAGKAVGALVGGPAGAMIGGQLANVAGKAMGLELQEMSPQEADLAAARQFVRFANDTLRRAQATNPATAAPPAIVQQAVRGAAERFAPGLLNRQSPRLRIAPTVGRRRGVWIRRGRTITLFGV